MIAQPVCGILMSKHLYPFLPTANLSSAVRAIHLPMANWGFVLMSLHAGTHLSAVLPKGEKRNISLACIGAVSLYGAYAFAKRQIPAFMFGKLAFVFFDYSESIGFFILDYLAVMILFALAGYGFTKATK